MYGGFNFHGSIKYFVLEFAEYEISDYLKLQHVPELLSMKQIFH